MNYTKGEWEATEMAEVNRAEDRCRIALVYDPYDGRWGTDTARANAHLIAAAPDMYVILADIAEALDKGTERLGVGREMILRQALAKAEGGA